MKYFYVIGGIALLIFVVYVGMGNMPASQPAQTVVYDGFAQCLKDKGTIFYGAFWCPHCQDQKKEFEGSAKLLPYVECSEPNAKDQTQVCKDAGIKSYPTWKFADGTVHEGGMTLQELSEKTTCIFPQ